MMEGREAIEFVLKLALAGKLAHQRKDVSCEISGGYTIQPSAIGLYTVHNEKGMVCDIYQENGKLLFMNASDDLTDFITMVRITM